MLSYPNGNNPTHHPNVLSLAMAAHRAQVDLRILVLTRNPIDMLVSLVLHRHFQPMEKETHMMLNNLDFLSGQLEALNKSSYYCIHYEDGAKDAKAVAEYLLGDFDIGENTVRPERLVSVMEKVLHPTQTNEEERIIARKHNELNTAMFEHKYKIFVKKFCPPRLS